MYARCTVRLTSIVDLNAINDGKYLRIVGARSDVGAILFVFYASFHIFGVRFFASKPYQAIKRQADNMLKLICSRFMAFERLFRCHDRYRSHGTANQADRRITLVCLNL